MPFRKVVYRCLDAGHFHIPSSPDLSGRPGPVDCVVDRMNTAVNECGCAPYEALTGRQKECLGLAAGGKTTSEIAIILGLSAHTVGHHLNEAQARLDAVNRVQAVATAIRRGII